MNRPKITSRILSLILTLVLLVLPSLSGCGERPEQYETKSSGEIVYKKVKSLELGLDILYPTNRKSLKNPTVLVFHGGGWISGERSDFLYEFEPLCNELRENGITVVAVSYRKALNGLTIRDCLDDCEDALEYLINNADKYDIDTERLGLIGYSAGAQLAMMTSIETGDLVKYCVSMSGPTCFSDSVSSPFYSEALAYYMSLIFDSEDSFGFYRESPIVGINKRCETAFLLVSGSDDSVILPEHARRFVKEAESFSLDAECIIVDGMTHSYTAYHGFDELCGDIAARMVKRLYD